MCFERRQHLPDASSVLGCPPSTVQSRLHEAYAYSEPPSYHSLQRLHSFHKQSTPCSGDRYTRYDYFIAIIIQPFSLYYRTFARNTYPMHLNSLLSKTVLSAVLFPADSSTHCFVVASFAYNARTCLVPRDYFRISYSAGIASTAGSFLGEPLSEPIQTPTTS